MLRDLSIWNLEKKFHDMEDIRYLNTRWTNISSYFLFDIFYKHKINIWKVQKLVIELYTQSEISREIEDYDDVFILNKKVKKEKIFIKDEEQLRINLVEIWIEGLKQLLKDNKEYIKLVDKIYEKIIINNYILETDYITKSHKSRKFKWVLFLKFEYDTILIILKVLDKKGNIIKEKMIKDIWTTNPYNIIFELWKFYWDGNILTLENTEWKKTWKLNNPSE